MSIKSVRSLFFHLLLGAVSTLGAFAVPTVSLDLDTTQVAVGDIVTVKVNLKDNPGTHGVYFDLAWDQSVFGIVSLNPGALVAGVNKGNANASDFLYAVADPTTSASLGAHAVISWAMNQNTGLFSGDGRVADVRFKVLAKGTAASYKFSFRSGSTGLIGLNQTPVAGAAFVGSNNITIGNSTTGYVHINAPAANSAVVTSSVKLSATSTSGTGLYYYVTNKANQFKSAKLSALSGSLTNYNVDLEYGINVLGVELYDANNSLIASDSRSVHRVEDSQFVRIVSPADHALVNTDMVNFSIISNFDNVTLNGQAVKKSVEKYQQKNLFTKALWLKKGFNKIVARAQNNDSVPVTFTHEILVYYEKDETAFNFVTPLSGTIFKADKNDLGLVNGNLKVFGEIGSRYQSAGIENTVTLRVLYRPRNPAFPSKILVQDQKLSIVESTLVNGQSSAPYMFTNSTDIPVANLEAGELELIAYKNKSGNSSEAEIHRIVYLDKSSLSIQLAQPNIFGIDLLDTKTKIKGFNHAQDPSWTTVDLKSSGELGLKASNLHVVENPLFSGKNLVDQIKTKDGTLYALVNDTAQSKLYLYEKRPQDVDWKTEPYPLPNKFGYCLAETDIGILVGVSGLFSSSDSGLYLFANKTFNNISIGQPIAHVQFIENKNGTIYLYGNGYSHLYSFNIYSLEDLGNSKYRAGNVQKIPFSNDLYLKQFVLSEDARTALLLTNTGKLSVYQLLGGTAYSRVEFDTALLPDSATFQRVVKAEYDTGSYNAYLLLSKTDTGSSAGVLMENKDTHRLILNPVVNGFGVPGETFLAAGFAQNRFQLAYQKVVGNGFEYRIRAANILFNQLDFDLGPDEFYPSIIDLSVESNPSYRLLPGWGETWAVQTVVAKVNKIFGFVRQFPATGSVTFDYSNPDLAALNGFSFLVDSRLLDTAQIALGFNVLKTGVAPASVLSTPDWANSPLSLKDLLAVKNDLYTVSHSFDVASGLEQIKVLFTNPSDKQDLQFNWKFTTVNNVTYGISGLTLYKKVDVKVPRSGASTIVFPIQGWVGDPTVKQIKIQEVMIPVEQNGYFSYNYLLNTTQKETAITLSCYNSLGERASLSFVISLFESLNEMTGVKFYAGALAEADQKEILPETSSDGTSKIVTSKLSKVLVSGSFAGLEGAVVGYETFTNTSTSGTAVYTKIDSGVFQTTLDAVTRYPADAVPGPGYASGSFVKQAIPLYAGQQRVIVYIDNPGGKRAEFTLDGKPIDINYQLPDAEQNIQVLNPDLKDLTSRILSNVSVNKQLEVSIQETKTTTGQYVYTKTMTLNGRVNTLYAFTDLRVKSLNSNAVFSNGLTEITIPVDNLKRFSTQIQLSVPESVDSVECPILLIPTAPYLEWMKTGVVLNAVKNYADSHIIPDFSLMDGVNWTQAEKTAYEKPLRVKITRHLPANTYLTLLVNYETPIAGRLVEDVFGSGIYRVVDENQAQIKLTGVKNGSNRLRWELSKTDTISSSISGKPDCQDYLFDVDFTSTYIKTQVIFAADAKSYYDENTNDTDGGLTLPALTVNKQANTLVNVFLNGLKINTTGDGPTTFSLDLKTFALVQGKNTVEVQFAEKNGLEGSKTFTFLYDTKSPIVTLGDSTYTRNAANTVNVLKSFSILVKEANLQKVELFQMNGSDKSLVSATYDMVSLDDQTVRITWNNLDQLTTQLTPDATHGIFATVTDYRNKTADSLVFMGVTELNAPAQVLPTALDLGTSAWNETQPTFMSEPSAWGINGFKNRLKVYNSNIEITGLSLTSGMNYIVNRPGTVILNSVTNSGGTNTLTVKAGQQTVLNPNFALPPNTALDIWAPATAPKASSFSVTHAQDSNEVGLGFWLRIEEEKVYAEDPSWKKVLVLAKGIDTGSNNAYEVYVAYRDPSHQVNGDEKLALIEWRATPVYNGQILTGYTNEIKDRVSPEMALPLSGQNGWNLVLVSIIKQMYNGVPYPLFKLSVNQDAPLDVSFLTTNTDFPRTPTTSLNPGTYLPQMVTSALAENAVYTFGETNGANGTLDWSDRNGHFSLAQPFIIDRAVSAVDMPALEPKLKTAFFALNADTWNNPSGITAATYDFDRTESGVTSVGTKYLQLTAGNSEPEDYNSLLENSDYSQISTAQLKRGSYLATPAITNRLKLDANGNLVFIDAANPVLDRMTAVQGTGDATGTLVLSPTSEVYPGRYSFANTFGSHTIVNADNYTISGTVGLPAGKTELDAELVVVINGKEQRYTLVPGDFHFVYNNAAKVTPTKVVMFIEAKKALLLSKTMFFTEGNYKLPPEAFAGLKRTTLTTKYQFQKAGTISFWYKPLTANKQGFVDTPATLFDSEFATIKTVGNSSFHQVFGVDLRGFNSSGATLPGINIITTVPVREGWQFVQFSWNYQTQVAYLFVNGVLAGKIEPSDNLGDIPLSPAMLGTIPTGPNVSLGSSLDLDPNSGQPKFANGYLDHVQITNDFALSTYVNNDPVTITYTDGFDANENALPALTFTLNPQLTAASFNSFALQLVSQDGAVLFQSNTSNPTTAGLDISLFPAGPYQLKVKADVNGYRFAKVITFTKNDRPRILLKERTSLIVANEPTILKFNFAYDKSYLLEKDLQKYAGLELKVTGRNSGVEFTRIFHVVQDFTEFSHNDKWLIYDSQSNGIPAPLTVVNNEFTVEIPGVKSSEALSWTYRDFYFDNTFTTTAVPDPLASIDQQGTIGLAKLDTKIMSTKLGDKVFDYKVLVKLALSDLTSLDTVSDFTLSYTTKSLSTGTTRTSPTPLEFNANGQVILFYDDLAKGLGVGEFDVLLTLLYKGSSIATYPLAITKKEAVAEQTMVTEKRLAITELSLLQINKSNSGTTGQFYLAFEQSGFFDTNSQSILQYKVSVSQTDDKGVLTTSYESAPATLNAGQTFLLLKGIPLPAALSTVRVTLFETVGSDTGLTRTRDLSVQTQDNPPTVLFTNSVDSRISYNNVKFTWIGYQNNSFNPDITYSYNFDNKGWSTANTSWRSLELYQLAEGYHTLRVQAFLGANNASAEAVANFFVDIHRPVFDGTKIAINKVYDAAGFLYQVNLVGAVGAVSDASLDALLINDKPVNFNSDGSFVANGLPITLDGDNALKLVAYDKVGNFTESTLVVNNNLTEILYPKTGSSIVYSPVTVVGRLPAKINNFVNVYIRDVNTPPAVAGDYSAWKKARVNEDFTFFVEDLTVNPGTAARQAVTTYDMAIVTTSGQVYTRKISVFAGEVVRPIDLTLSTRAVAGENAETSVTIEASAKVGNISSWSIDYTGDGIYDDVAIIDNPAAGQLKTWTHVYSSLGLVKPRVRVITRDGNYFSVDDELIIHESIREASNKLIDSPVALSTLTMPDKSQRLYVLAGNDGAFRIEVYEIGRNETYVSNKLYQVLLAGMGIEKPVKIFALDDKTLIVAENKNGGAVVHTLVADEFDAFSVKSSVDVVLPDALSDVTADAGRLYLSTAFSNMILTVDLVNGLPVPSTLKANPAVIKMAVDAPEGTVMDGLSALGGSLALSHDDLGLMVADYDNQRLVRVSDQFTMQEYLGQQGTGEGEFIKPSLLKSYQDRLFVYDEGRSDIQVFDPQLKPIARLSYQAGGTNYLDANFLNSVTGISAFAREEGNRLFYYAILLSKSSGKLAVLRLPQWQEMRAKVRNNKIIFLKDNEVFSAKPNGADLTRLASTDSIPRINGTVDYPALSPDGKRITFTSRAKLYDGSGLSTAGTTYAYDNLYVMNVNGTELQRIPLSAVQGYEIERPVFNSNGTQLIFSAKPTGGTWQIYVYNFETGGVQRLFNSDENARFPYFSPDDRFVVFTTDYDGDEDIQIFDTQNSSTRVIVTNNRARDSFPVWSTVYPFEIGNSTYKIESKIAFVSERSRQVGSTVIPAHKGVYVVYLSRPSEGDLRVVKKDTGAQTGNDPDSAAIEITAADNGDFKEGDYPSFTGDGTAVVYEYFNGLKDQLKRYDFTSKTAVDIPLDAGSRRPSGMKNTISQFKAEIANGNDVRLSWSRYTDSDIFYNVRFRINRDGEPFVEKRVFTQGSAVLPGLEMGVEYLVRVSIEENGEEAAATQWQKILIPEVAARPTVTIDPANPYLVRLKAWKPKPETDWGYSWLIDNNEIQVQNSTDYLYEFATSGTKTIVLKAHNKANTFTNVSEPVTVKINSDIKPVVEYVLADDRSYVELSAEKSLGNRIDWSSAVWTITGPGVAQPQVISGSKAIINLSGYKYKINVNLKLARVNVNGQQGTDNLQTNMIIDLDYRGTKLVITQTADPANPNLITFSGANSIGNVNWREAQWAIYRDGQPLVQKNGVSSFAYEFPESGHEARYSATLSVPRMSDGLTETVSNLVSVGPTELEAVIDYEVLEMKNAQGAVTGAKIVFSAGNSKGNNIDFAQAKWTLPVAGSYSEQPTQVGPTAVYNLFNVGSDTLVDISLTLSRRGSGDFVTTKKTISVKGGQMAKPEIKVNANLITAASGQIAELDVLKSTGPNIDWEKTSWQFSNTINGQPQNAVQNGPSARLEIPASADKTVIRYTVTMYITGTAQPLVYNGELRTGAATLYPLINVEKVQGGAGNVYNLSVSKTQGFNIDWERTTWYLYDGADTVNQKYGAQITHAFVRKDKAMGYPVVVTMFMKNSAVPFTGYTSIDIEGDEMKPVIKWDNAEATAGSEILFTADGSTGSGIDWSQAKWTFGDGSPSQYGSAVGHKYAYSTANAEYKVSLTLTRRLPNGETETKTTFTPVTIGKDEVKPVVTARYDAQNKTLTLTAADSEGRGLQLDRSIWDFAARGAGSTREESNSDGTKYGTNWEANVKAWARGGYENTIAWYYNIGMEVSGGYGQAGSDYKNTDNKTTTAFSNENSHTGITVRRSLFNNESMVTVSLSVYRVDADGKLVGKTITVNVNLSEAAKPEGKQYK